MAIDEQNPTRWAWDTKLTTLATATTLALATRYDTEAQTIYVPETVAGRFNILNGARVLVRVTVRDAETVTATDLDGVRIGIKINAVAFDDLDTAITTVGTLDHWNGEFWRDVTAYFNTNDPGTASFTAQVGVAFATGAASLVNNITFELFLVYGFDSALATTQARTAVFPIQSHHLVLPTAGAFVEVGTTLGTANAPVNQIRKLTGAGGAFDGVTGFVLRKRYLILYAHDAGNGIVDFTPQIRFDAGVANARATLESALDTSVRWIDIIDITALSTAAAHSLEVDPGLAARMDCVGALDVVTYEYTASSAVQFVSKMVPLSQLNCDDLADRNTSVDPDRWTAEFQIQEPGAITMDQVGVVFVAASNVDTVLAATGQTVRTYDVFGGTVRAGYNTLVHRCDHSLSNWSLARGANRLSFDAYKSVAPSTTQHPSGGYALINYRCGKHADGAHKHSKTILGALVVPMATSTANNTTVTPDEPVIVTPDYVLEGTTIEQILFVNGTQPTGIAAKRLAAEDSGAGWWRSYGEGCAAVPDTGSFTHWIPCTKWFRRRGAYSHFGSGGNIEAERKWHSRVGGGGLNVLHEAALYVTYHSMTFTVAGAVTVGGVPVVNGKTVKVWAVDSENQPELIGSPVTTGGTGSFTLEVPDDTRTYFATYKDGATLGRSDDGTPETSTFNITIGGVGDVTAPTITIVSPTPGVAPGAPGGFPADHAAALQTPIVLDITDVGGRRYECVVCRYAGSSNERVIWRRGAFRGEFAASVSAVIANGIRLTVLPAGGWPPTLQSLADVEFDADAVDTSGNLAA